jgi:dTDP-glucose 4,6-dehydratase
MKILVTGGAGFIGSNFVRRLLARTSHSVINVDKLTYAARLESLPDARDDPRHALLRSDICDGPRMREIMSEHKPDAVVHLAAESHVDRSIEAPGDFMRTNIMGTYELLEAARGYWEGIPASRRAGFRFLHVSTDEVFGSRNGSEAAFNEASRYDPHSPYAASKAGSDHLVRAWGHTYGLPVVVTNSSNNYGPYQFPEKLVPLVILKALRAEPIPVYGDGSQIRDWLHVDDHADGLLLALERGRIGATYCFGANEEHRNIDLVRKICRLVDELLPNAAARPHERLISFVEDRPGHDFRYAIDSSRARRELAWDPRERMDGALRRTVEWYLSRRDWWESILATGARWERTMNLPSAAAPARAKA